MQKRFLEDVMLFIIKSFLPLRTLESVWFQRLAFKLCPKVSFSSRKVFTKKVLPSLVNTTSTEFVQFALVECLTATCTFDLWMSKGAHDVFAMVVNFLSISLEPKHVTVGLFEASNTNGVAMAMKVKQILKKFGLTQKIMAYVKDESSNLATCAQALKAVVSCVNLDKAKPFDGHCFGHTLSRVCQYVIFDEKVGFGLLYASIKSTQVDVQKCITWPNKSNNRQQAWEKACVNFGLNPHTFNTHMKTR